MKFSTSNEWIEKRQKQTQRGDEPTTITNKRLKNLLAWKSSLNANGCVLHAKAHINTYTKHTLVRCFFCFVFDERRSNTECVRHGVVQKSFSMWSNRNSTPLLHWVAIDSFLFLFIRCSRCFCTFLLKNCIKLTQVKLSFFSSFCSNVWMCFVPHRVIETKLHRTEHFRWSSVCTFIVLFAINDGSNKIFSLWFQWKIYWTSCCFASFFLFNTFWSFVRFFLFHLILRSLVLLSV